MTFRQKLYWLFFAVALALVLNIFFGRYLSAKLSTWPLLNKFGFVVPQAPIVITTKQEVRVSDSGDVLNAIEAAKAKLSILVSTDGGQVKILGSAINLTSDGEFMTTAAAFGAGSQTYAVLLSDGRGAAVGQKVLDPATGLIYFKANLSNVPAAAFGSSGDLGSGDKVVGIMNSLVAFTPAGQPTYVTAPQSLVSGKVFDADRPSQSFGIKDTVSLKPGEAIINLKGEVVGMWSGTTVVAADVLRNSSSVFLANPAVFVRPLFGFTYIMINPVEASLLNQAAGAKVQNVVKTARNNLQPGDLITKLNNDQVSQETSLENLLSKYKPGDTLNLTVVRSGQTINLSFVVGELK